MTIANLFTVARLVLVPIFVLAAIRQRHDVAFFVFVGAAITDALDGWIARTFDQRSKLGAVLDPAADKLMLVSGYVVYTFYGIAATSLPIALTISVFARDVLIVFVAWLLFSRVRVRSFPPSIPGKVSTILQAIALGATVAANMWLEPVARPILSTFQMLALAMTVISGLDYVRRWALILEVEGWAEQYGVESLDREE